MWSNLAIEIRTGLHLDFFMLYIRVYIYYFIEIYNGVNWKFKNKKEN